MQLPIARQAAVFFAATALLAFFAAWCTTVARSTSETFDEPGFLVAGTSYLTPGAPEVATTNLRLAQLWLALPLRGLKPHLPETSQPPNSLVLRRDVELGRAFLADPRNDATAILSASRAANTALGVLLGAVLFFWSRQLHGNAAGLITLAFFCFEPVVAANSFVATTDIATALLFVVAVWAIWRLLHAVTLPNVVGCGLAIAALAATKLTSALLPVIVLPMLAMRLKVGPALRRGIWRPHRSVAPGQMTAWALGAAGATCIIGYVTLWAIYGFRFSAAAQPASEIWSATPGSAPGLHRLVDWTHDHRVLPEAYLSDIKDFLLRSNVRRAFLLGDYAVTGWWYFFPVAWFFKTPLPALIAFALALGVTILAWRQRSASGDKSPLNWYELTPLSALAFVYGLFAIFGPLNIGIRHLLPVYPLFFVLLGTLAHAHFFTAKRRTLLIAGLVGWSALEAVRGWSHPMAYLNPFGGGSAHGYRVLVDSSYEWGQDLPALQQWLQWRSGKPGAPGKVFLSYFGNSDLRRFKIEATLLPHYYDDQPAKAYALEPGTYIISATMLESVYGWAMGPWRPSLEQRYQELMQDMLRLQNHLTERASLDQLFAAEGQAVWAKKIRMYDDLRFARLCACLRAREPDYRITPGLLVYEVAFDELKAALADPPRELRTNYRINGAERIAPENLDFIP